MEKSFYSHNFYSFSLILKGKNENCIKIVTALMLGVSFVRNRKIPSIFLLLTYFLSLGHGIRVEAAKKDEIWGWNGGWGRKKEARVYILNNTAITWSNYRFVAIKCCVKKEWKSGAACECVCVNETRSVVTIDTENVMWMRKLVLNGFMY